MKHHPNGMPNFPGQPRRLYMAGTARFLTRVREAEWLGGEHPYAYAKNNPVTYSDPSGNDPNIIGCGRDAKAFLKKVCRNLVNHIDEDVRRQRINRCISTFSYRVNVPCPLLDDKKSDCLKAWCKNGRVECYKKGGIPGRPLDGGWAGEKGCVQIAPKGSPLYLGNPKDEIQNKELNAVYYFQPWIGKYPGEKDGTSFSLLALTMLHEFGHKCDIWHGNDPDGNKQQQCNDIWAFCIYNSIWGGRYE